MTTLTLTTLTTMTFQLFADDFKPEVSGGLFLRMPEQGDFRVALLGAATVGYSYWNTSDSCVRMQEKPDVRPADMREKNKFGNVETLRQFIALPALDMDAGQVGILELTQSSIIAWLYDNSQSGEVDFGSMYVRITKTKKGQKVSFTLSAVPFSSKYPKPTEAQYEEAAAIDMYTAMFQQVQNETVESSNGGMAVTAAEALQVM